MRILFIITFLVNVFSGFSQGIEPYQIQYSKFKGGFLQAKIPIYDDSEQDTVYYYAHVDSIVSGMVIDSVKYFSDSLRIYTNDTTFVTEILSNPIDSINYLNDSLYIYTTDQTFSTEIIAGQEYDLIPYSIAGDTVGFILYNSMDTVMIMAGDSLIGGNISIVDGYGINSILSGDTLYTISVDTSQIATQYDLSNVQSTLTFNDGNTVDFTTTGNTITAEVKASSIGANEIQSTSVVAGSYTNSNITVDSDGRITNASNGSGGTITVTDGNTIDFTLTGTNLTGEVKVNSIDSTHLKENSVRSSELENTQVIAGLYHYPSITIDEDGRITGAITNTFNLPVIIKQNTDQTTSLVTTSTSGDLSTTITDVGMYEVTGIVSFTSSATGTGFVYGFAANTNIAFASGTVSVSINNTNSAENIILDRIINSIPTSPQTVTGSGVGQTNSIHSGMFSFIFYNTTVNNTLQFRYASEIAGSSVTLKANSYYKIQKLW